MVKFKNGVELDTIAVYGGGMTFQGSNRDTLEFRVAEDKTTFDELKAVYSDPSALSEIEITDGGNGEVKSLHLNYTLPVELGLMQIDGEQIWHMKLAQKSALELAQEQQAADINDTQLALIELAEMLAGGED